MSRDIPTTEPAIQTIGDTLEFTKDLADYLPQDGWTLTYTLVNASAQIQFSGSDNGDGTHLIDVAAATTAGWTAGDYRWQATVSDGSDRFTVARGTMELRADFDAQTTGYDGRGTWETILAQLESAYLAMSAGEIKTATISHGGRTQQYRSLEELIAAINHAKQQAALEEKANRLAEGLNPGSRVLVRFK
jgi:hypothetical protein